MASPQLAGRWPWSPEFKNFEVVDTKEKAADAVRKFKQERCDEIKNNLYLAKRSVGYCTIP
jgi:hypothetical protein